MIAFGSDFRSDFGRQDGAKTGSRGLQDGQDGPKRPQDDPQGAPKTAPRGFQKTDPRHPFLVLAARCLQGPPRTPPRAILKPFLIDSRPLQHRKNPLTSTLKNTSEGGIRCLFPLPPPLLQRLHSSKVGPNAASKYSEMLLQVALKKPVWGLALG